MSSSDGTATIEKVALVSATLTKVSHHRSLPAGHYKTMNFRGKIYILTDMDNPDPDVLFLIAWGGDRRMLHEFVITADGTCEKVRT